MCGSPSFDCNELLQREQSVQSECFPVFACRIELSPRHHCSYVVKYIYISQCESLCELQAVIANSIGIIKQIVVATGGYKAASTPRSQFVFFPSYF